MKEHIRTAFMECIDSHHDKGFSFSEPELLDCCTYTYLGLQEKERDEKITVHRVPDIYQALRRPFLALAHLILTKS